MLADSALLFLVLAVAGVGLGLGQPVSLMWVAAQAGVGIRATALAVRISGNRLGQIVLPSLMGALVGATGLGALFWALAAILSSSSVLTAVSSFEHE